MTRRALALIPEFLAVTAVLGLICAFTWSALP